MRRLRDLLSEDSNQYGPGTDLMLSLLAVLLVMTLITSYLYRAEKGKRPAEQGGNFKLAAQLFVAGDFHARPVTELVDSTKTDAKVRSIVEEYRGVCADFPYLFVIGHSSQLDDPDARDKSDAGRLQRNWSYAGRRAALIAALMQPHLEPDERQRLVVVTTGEFDMRVPERPLSQENAWVEVVFAKEWKLPARDNM